MPEYHRISERTFRLVSEVTDLRPFFLAWRALNIWHSIHIIWLPRDAAVELRHVRICRASEMASAQYDCWMEQRRHWCAVFRDKVWRVLSCLTLSFIILIGGHGDMP